jgi:hypothetical protein
MSRRALVMLLTIALSAVSGGGCGVWRGIPTHGGGKRFDEEQRVIAQAIRQSLADMDLRDLVGLRTQIVIESLGHEGGGAVSFPGLSSINAGVVGNEGDSNSIQVLPGSPGGPSAINTNSNTGIGGNFGLNWNTNLLYSPHAFSTAPDLGYFSAALEMKARHAGVQPAAAEPQAILFVLVDVLGTNRSRRDSIVSNSDTLRATCECTYYAVNPQNGQLLFEARRASSAATYRETHLLGVTSVSIDRSAGRIEPTYLPVHDPQPATQPVLAERRGPMHDMLNWLAGAE